MTGKYTILGDPLPDYIRDVARKVADDLEASIVVTLESDYYVTFDVYGKKLKTTIDVLKHVPSPWLYICDKLRQSSYK